MTSKLRRSRSPLTQHHKAHCVVFAVLFGLTGPAGATRLAEFTVTDRDVLTLHYLDGEVFATDDASGPTAYTNVYNGGDKAVNYGQALNTSAAATAANWTLRSTDDADFSTPKSPANVYRKTKLNGMAEGAWASTDYVYTLTYEHTLFLKLPSSLKQGKHYTLSIASSINSDSASKTFTYDIYSLPSEAIHVNLVGYTLASPVKAADLYVWMGDGGARDYTAFAGNKVYLYNVATLVSKEVGAVSFGKAKATESSGYNLTGSSVWNADFPKASDTGTFRLAIEGVGCSRDFKITPDAYREPFEVGVKGYYYMRVGEDSVKGIRPVPRRPLWIPGKSPSNTVIYLTTMQPYDPNWTAFSNGMDPWDRKDEWATYRKPGNPTNTRSVGGHADAYDWDRHLGHVSSAFDMMLPYLLSKGAISDDDVGITESGNGIPDILDEARNEVDYWLSLRDGAGYSHGLNNPSANNVFYQAGPTAVAAWANAVDASMLGDALRIAGKSALSNEYRDSAIVAYNYANKLSDPMLDKTQDIGDSKIRGRDLKATAAAFLYNLTGDTAYEAVLGVESVCAKSTTADLDNGSLNQIYATAAYLTCQRVRHNPTLYANMKASVIYQARIRNVNTMNSRPSRRSVDDRYSYWQTNQNVHHALLAHFAADNPTDRDQLRKALELEADWGLGRNPANMIQMTTASTSLAGKRSVENMFTVGGNDGTPGMHPGHTPYMAFGDWSTAGMVMSRPSWLTSKCYPDFSNWPSAEGYFNTRYCYAHSEFTPQQTMRGKMALYGYLHGLGEQESGTVGIVRMTENVPKGKLGLVLTDRRATFQAHSSGIWSVKLCDLAGRVLWSSDASVEAGPVTLEIPGKIVGLHLIQVRGPGGLESRTVYLK